MEIRVLKYFLAVVSNGSISAAAEYLHMTQPTLSRQIMDLENELGKKLFIRGSKKITLTEDGVLLRKRAEEIISLVDRTESEISLSDSEIDGDVYIGGGETEGMRLIAKTAKKLKLDGYNITYHLFSGNSIELSEQLDKGLLDFAVFIDGTDIQKFDSVRLPYTDIWGVLMKKDSSLAGKSFISPQDLCDLPLIISRQPTRNSELANWLKNSDSKPNIAATYNLIYNAALMVEEGIGYALCLDKLIRLNAESSLCFKPLFPVCTAHLDIAWKRYQVFSKAAKLFINCLYQK